MSPPTNPQIQKIIDEGTVPRTNIVSFSQDVNPENITASSSLLKDIESNLMQSERTSGYPNPELYNKHCIHKYAFPKGLHAMAKPESQQDLFRGKIESTPKRNKNTNTK